MSKNFSIFLLGTYMPQKCGIAAFTTDLYYALKKNIKKANNIGVIAVHNNVEAQSDFPKEVEVKIQEQEKNDYRKAAKHINSLSNTYVLLQHEFGIFGGADGEYILSFIEELKCPLISTLHTVMGNPQAKQKEILQKICFCSKKVVVMSQKAVDLLVSIYQIKRKKIIFIPHGAYNCQYLTAKLQKILLGFWRKKILLTTGLINPNKGIEVMLRALKSIVKKVPNALYIILGTTHPKVKLRQGESYRLFLMDYVKKYNLQKNVLFIDEFCDFQELKKFLAMSDIYVAPYRAREQIVSGTLAYALVSGKAIVSTASWYAEEVLSNDRGLLVPFGNSKVLAKAVLKLFLDKKKRKTIEKKAYQFGKRMKWEKVGKMYVDLIKKNVF